MNLLTIYCEYIHIFKFIFMQWLTPLWDCVDSTRNILSTKSCCCWRAISNTSASKPNRKRRTIFRGKSSLFPVSPGWSEHIGILNKCLLYFNMWYKCNEFELIKYVHLYTSVSFAFKTVLDIRKSPIPKTKEAYFNKWTTSGIVTTHELHTRPVCF